MIKKALFSVPIVGKEIKRIVDERDRLLENLLISQSEDSAWIFTIQKSGTTYLLTFLANYLNRLFEGRTENINYTEMYHRFFIHSIENTVKKSSLTSFYDKKNDVVKNNLPYSRFLSTHIPIKGNYWKKNISLRRNPLDYIVSIHHYNYLKRGKKNNLIKTIKNEIYPYIALVNYQKSLIQSYPDKVLIIHYEDLIIDPINSFEKIIAFLGIEVDYASINSSITASSIKNVKVHEKEIGGAIVSESNQFKGSFIRSGAVGDWKNYLKNSEVGRIEQILNDNDIQLDEFTLE